MGVISAGTSQTDEPLAVLCRHLHIPLLITVATNDRLTSHTDGEETPSQPELRQESPGQRQDERELQLQTEEARLSVKRTTLPDTGIEGASADAIGQDPPSSAQEMSQDSSSYDLEERVVFRMLPNNTRQAITIADYIERHNSPANSKLIVFYEDNDYARLLFNKIDERLRARKYTMFAYEVEDSGSITQAMPSVDKLQDNATLVYLGYADHANDLLQALAAYKIDLPVILSDGCWSTRLIDNADRLRTRLSHLSIAFPTNPVATNTPLHGFALYGYEAYLLLAALDQTRVAEPGEQLIHVINRALEQIRPRGPGAGVIPASVNGASDQALSPEAFVHHFSPTGEPEEAPGKLTRFQLCDVPPTKCEYEPEVQR